MREVKKPTWRNVQKAYTKLRGFGVWARCDFKFMWNFKFRAVGEKMATRWVAVGGGTVTCRVKKLARRVNEACLWCYCACGCAARRDFYPRPMLRSRFGALLGTLYRSKPPEAAEGASRPEFFSFHINFLNFQSTIWNYTSPDSKNKENLKIWVSCTPIPGVFFDPSQSGWALLGFLKNHYEFREIYIKFVEVYLKSIFRLRNHDLERRPRFRANFWSGVAVGRRFREISKKHPSQTLPETPNAPKVSI